jgi:hypothetical protein
MGILKDFSNRRSAQLAQEEEQLAQRLAGLSGSWLRGWMNVMTAEPNAGPAEVIKYHFYDGLDYALISLYGRSHWYEAPEEKPSDAVVNRVYEILIEQFADQYPGAEVSRVENLQPLDKSYGDVSGNDVVRVLARIASNKNAITNEVVASLQRLGIENQYILNLAAKHEGNAAEFMTQIERLAKQAHDWTGKAKLFPTEVSVFPSGAYSTIFLDFPSPDKLASVIGSDEQTAKQIIKDINTNAQAHYDDVIGWIKFHKHPEKNAWLVKEIQSDVLQNWRYLKQSQPMSQKDLYTGKEYGLGKSQRPVWIEQYNAKIENLFRDYDKLLLNMVMETAQQNGVEQVWVPTGESVSSLYGRFVGEGGKEKISRIYDKLASLFGASGQEEHAGIKYSVIDADNVMARTSRRARWAS